MVLEMLRVKEADAVRVHHQDLKDIVARLFQSFKLSEEHARIVADVLVYADLRGIDSHGVSNSIRNLYVPRLLDGSFNLSPRPQVVHETPSTALVDGDAGMGMISGTYAMELTIQKAKAVGSGWVAVRNSKHYGAAGYYAGMALPHDMIGFSLTNSGPRVAPTFGRWPMFGTNPIAVAAPTKNEPPFIMDFATSTVAVQKVDIASFLGVKIPEGWVVDREGHPITDPKIARENRVLLPLGGSTKEQGSHKGYSLAVMVDILSGVLSGAGYGAILGGKVGHFFGAWRIDAFRPAEEFKEMMDEMIRAMRNSEKAAGHERIYVAGEPEHEIMAERMVKGIPLHRDVVTYLRELAKEQGVKDTLPPMGQ